MRSLSAVPLLLSSCLVCHHHGVSGLDLNAVSPFSGGWTNITTSTTFMLDESTYVVFNNFTLPPQYYNVIARNTLSLFVPPAEGNETAISTASDDGGFYANSIQNGGVECSSLPCVLCVLVSS
eukprot:TRINITY_DN16256_c0_g1_i1.p1 TRINITY_DN16256_c0_g1~~TRINITY_DN16256_c0_g1_i1.p1  ORF type:complete len:123 (-),score=20.73 TRINITY_DN16256_c0_g1_i1:37-405(-)